MQIDKTIIVNPDFLGVGIALITELEHCQEENREWYYVYSKYLSWMGFDSNLRIEFEPVYLRLKTETLNQTILFETESKEVATEVAKVYHTSMIKVAELAKDLIKLKTFEVLANDL